MGLSGSRVGTDQATGTDASFVYLFHACLSEMVLSCPLTETSEIIWLGTGFRQANASVDPAP